MKNNYNKINFLYRNTAAISSSYACFRGLKTALERNGLLHYAYDVMGTESLNINELLKYPLLCIGGSWEPLFHIVKLISGRQFVAEINTEFLFPRKGAYTQSPILKLLHLKLLHKKKYFKVLKLLYQKDFSEVLKLFKRNIFGPKGSRKEKDYFSVLKSREKYFDLYFSGVDKELNRYFGKPCYWFPAWAHTELLDDISSPVSTKLGFIGTIMGSQRKRFFKQDKNKIIEIANTVPKNDSLENVKELCKLINKYKYLVAPMCIAGPSMPGKVFEYMACERLCFCQLDEKHMFKHQLLFEDGKEIVYFKTFAELEEKYRYYLKNPEEANQIAQAGYKKVRKYHNADKVAIRFAKLVLHHANGGKYDESYNDVSLFGGNSIFNR